MLLLLLAASGCSSMTARSGIVVIGGRPAFQASIEIGPSAFGKRHGVTAGQDWGLETDVSGTRAVSGFSLDLFQKLRLGRDIAEGLAEAHSRGIIHRDLKANNVTVTPSGHA